MGGLHVNPLPLPLGDGELVAWRLDQANYARTWDSGEGAFQLGGRWNSKNVRAVYCSVDPATAILEVAVHRGFRVLDTVCHVMTAVTMKHVADFKVITRAEIPNENWLRPGIPSTGQQAFGNQLLRDHKLFLIPSSVSTFSWNLIFDASSAKEFYSLRMQETFALDPRLHPSR